MPKLTSLSILQGPGQVRRPAGRERRHGGPGYPLFGQGRVRRGHQALNGQGDIYLHAR